MWQGRRIARPIVALEDTKLARLMMGIIGGEYALAIAGTYSHSSGDRSLERVDLDPYMQQRRRSLDSYVR